MLLGTTVSLLLTPWPRSSKSAWWGSRHTAMNGSRSPRHARARAAMWRNSLTHLTPTGRRAAARPGTCIFGSHGLSSDLSEVLLERNTRTCRVPGQNARPRSPTPAFTWPQVLWNAGAHACGRPTLSMRQRTIGAPCVCLEAAAFAASAACRSVRRRPPAGAQCMLPVLLRVALFVHGVLTRPRRFGPRGQRWGVVGVAGCWGGFACCRLAPGWASAVACLFTTGPPPPPRAARLLSQGWWTAACRHGACCQDPQNATKHIYISWSG